MADKWIDQDLKPKVKDILSRSDEYHKKYYTSETFFGPSLHFHQRALEVKDANWTAKVELIYAVLTSWGMHRMGASGSKMQSFVIFKESIAAVKREIKKLQQAVPQNLSLSDWHRLEKVFKEMKVMASGTTIVGNSKVLAHLIPNLVAPVDREYTLNYLFGSKTFPNDLDREGRLMYKIHEEFYYPVSQNKIFQKKAKRWMADIESFPWDTSNLKIIDNLVIGAMRKKKNAELN